MLRIFSEIHDQSTLYNGKIYNINFWIGNEPPPPRSELFRKFIRFGMFTHSLKCKSKQDVNIEQIFDARLEHT